MILKFRIPTCEDPAKQGWKMVDGLESVIFWTGKTSEELITANDGDAAGASCIYLRPGGQQQSVNIVECVRNGTDQRKYVFSTEGYICNDEGQTLERLIP